MDISDFITPSQVIIDLRVSRKVRLLEELARMAADLVDLPAEVILSALSKREELGSTGTGSGVAIPHARLPGIRKPFAILVRLHKGIDFDAIDGKPVDIVALVLLPANAQDTQLNALACVARALREANVLQGIRRAGDNAAAYRALVMK
jgi:PTS system nitrogen regulatory IIA component